MRDALRLGQPTQTGHTTRQTMNQGSHAKRPKVKTMPYPTHRRRRFVEMETPSIDTSVSMRTCMPPCRQGSHRPARAWASRLQGSRSRRRQAARTPDRAKGLLSLTNKIHQVAPGLRPGVRHLCRPTGCVPRPQHFQKGPTRRARTLHDHLDPPVREIRRGAHQAKPATSRSNICAKTNTLNSSRHPRRETDM